MRVRLPSWLPFGVVLAPFPKRIAHNWTNEGSTPSFPTTFPILIHTYYCMKSDFKNVVKESLREAFYTEKANNKPVIKMVINGELYFAIFSKNNTPNKRPYKITFFKMDKETRKLVPSPAEPWDIDWEEMEYMLKSGKMPDRFNQNFTKYHIEPPELIFKENVTQPSNEVLLFLENSARELELYIDNKR